MKCRGCGKTNLKTFLDLGKIPLVDKFKSKRELVQKEKHFPLTVCICISCKFVQLGYILPPKSMFNSKYAYESSTTQFRTEVYFDMAKDLCKRFKLEPNSLVVDIGSNIGVLIREKKCAAQVVNLPFIKPKVFEINFNFRGKWIYWKLYI